jgi:hypothetical protein
MNELQRAGFSVLFHATPIHLLGLVAKEQALLSKAQLQQEGLGATYFRSTSRNRNFRLGFSNMVHLFQKPNAPLLLDKLRKGYPHVELAIPDKGLEEGDYFVCWFNIAKNRVPDWQWHDKQSPTRGYIRPPFRIPVVSTPEEKRAMLGTYGASRHLEVLVNDRLELPEETTVTAFDVEEAKTIRHVLETLGNPWRVVQGENSSYQKNLTRSAEFQQELRKSACTNSKPQPLEFDL